MTMNMLNFPTEAYSVLNLTFEALNFDAEKRDRLTEEFEKTLLKEFAAGVITKLPEGERRGVVELANSAKTKEKIVELQKKLSFWLTEDEIKSLFRKISDNLFGDFVRQIYKSATDKNKKKMEGIFKLEALKG